MPLGRIACSYWGEGIWRVKLTRDGYLDNTVYVVARTAGEARIGLADEGYDGWAVEEIKQLADQVLVTVGDGT